MRILRRICLICVALLLILAITVGFVMRERIASMLTVACVDENGLLYSMEYQGDYDLEPLFRGGSGDADRFLGFVFNQMTCGLVPTGLFRFLDIHYTDFACTSFSVRCNDGHTRVGRNYDEEDEGALVLTSRPAEGYASVSVCTPVYMGVDVTKLDRSLFQKFLSLGLLMVPMDGMNEMGLCVTVEELNHHPALPSTDKPDILQPSLMRLILDRCATVEEAVDMISQFDLSEPQTCLDQPEIVGCATHLLLADATGAGAVVEFDYENGFRPIVIYGDASHQVLTNHYIAPQFLNEGDDHGESRQRYDLAEEMLNRADDVDEEDCFDILSAARMERVCYPEYEDCYCSTQWSCVYDLTEKTMSIAVGRNYDEIYTFSLNEDR